MFLYKSDRQKHRKLLEQMENDLLQRKDPFPKTVVDTCRILAGWKNKYGNRDNIMSNAIDVMAFATTGEENYTRHKKGKKTDITQTDVMKRLSRYPTRKDQIF